MKKPVAIVLAMLLCSLVFTCAAGAVDAPHYDTAAGNVCGTCHTVQLTLGSTGYNNICLTCHRPGDPAAGGKPLTLADQANPFGLHSTSGVTTSYQTSHRWDGADSNQAAGAQPPLQAQMTSNGLRSRTGNQLACVRCHNQHDKGAEGKFLRMANDRDQLCLDCHRSRDVQSHTGGSHPVGVAYNSANPAFKVISSASSNPAANLKRYLKNGAVSCSTCHGVHFTDSRSSTDDGSAAFANVSSGDGYLLRADRRGTDPGVGNDALNLCSTCHAGKTSHNKHGQNIQCNDCHGAHVEYDPNDPTGSKGINAYLIRRSVAKGTSGTGKIFFVYTAARLEYKNANNTGVCQGCHAVPTGSNSSDKHALLVATAQDCQGCHTHGTPVGVSGAGSFSAACGGCHATPPNGSSFPNIAGSHAIHVGNNSITFCQTCHTAPDSLNHNNGTVNLLPAVGFSANSCSTAICHASPYGSNFSLTPSWYSAAGSIGCAACHSGGGAFTGVGQSPATGSHNKHMATSMSCGQCHLGTVAGAAGGNFHVNGSIDVANGYPANVTKHVAGTYAGTCTTTCHSVTTAAVKTPTWGTTSDCNSCHETVPTTGSHGLHLGVFSVCSDCHSGAIQGNSGGSSHLNSKIDVLNGYPANVSKHAAGVYSGTCSTASCHANPYGTLSVTTPVWGAETATHCTGCHNGVGAFTGIGSAPATGSHGVHMTMGASCGQCHTGASTSNGGNGHKDGTVSVANGYPANVVKHAAGTYSGTCATSTCHSSFGTPVWGVSTANDFCTKCHGTPTGSGIISAASNNRYLVAPSAPVGTDVGQVSANVKTGAHQTHLRFFNGFSNYSTPDYRCEACHGTLPAANSFIHADGSASPQGKFQNLATNWGRMTAPTYTTGGSCSNTYCHNPAGSGGTLTAGMGGTNSAPSWTDYAYLADGTHKTLANCNKCHKVPGESGFTGFNHGAITIADSCVGCHGHEGDTQGSVGMRHMDGIKFGGGSTCNSCHGYPPLSPADFASRGGGFVDASLENYAGGGGHHAVHLLSTVTIADGFTPCLPCHPNSYHNQGGGNVSKSNVNVNDVADTGYRFDSNRSKRYDAVSMSCSNVSCHFQPTTSW
jgi:predicted CxxxxCH...CXXCH cytochrome family protein